LPGPGNFAPIHFKNITSGQKPPPFPFGLKYRAFRPAWKAASGCSMHRFGGEISTDKSAQRGQINTAGFHIDSRVKKMRRAKKSRGYGRLWPFGGTGPGGFSEMVFDLLIPAKPFASWQNNLQSGCIKTEQNTFYIQLHGKI
jgi:hypothetical protein